MVLSRIGKAGRSAEKDYGHKTGPGAYDVVQTGVPSPSYTFSSKHKRDRVD